MAKLTPDQEECKKAIFDKIPPRRRKFIEKMGYENWDPFQAPFDPIDIRVDPTQRNHRQLLNSFFRAKGVGDTTGEYARGAIEMCMGLIKETERQKGGFDFSVWYSRLLESERPNDKQED